MESKTRPGGSGFVTLLTSKYPDLLKGTYTMTEATIEAVEGDEVAVVHGHGMPIEIRVIDHLPGTLDEMPARPAPQPVPTPEDYHPYVVKIDGEAVGRFPNRTQLDKFLDEKIPTLKTGQEISVTG